MTNRSVINYLVVLCDPRRVQRIGLTCRCSYHWTEQVPGEIHESQMVVQFECPDCHTVYHLQNKHLSRVKEDSNDTRQKFDTIRINTDSEKRGFDA